jgi:hypothetical protein
VYIVVTPIDGSQPIFIVAGGTEANLSCKGGVMVPQPLVVLGPFFGNEPGALRVTSRWPNGAPAGVKVVVQAWIQDVSQTLGWAATNGSAGLSLD